MSLALDYANQHREIVEACQSGNRRAQNQLYNLYSKAMYNICYRMMGNQMEAEDVLQNSFIDVFTKLHTFRFQSSVGAWIKRIVINNCINQIKKRKLTFELLDDRYDFAENHPPEKPQADLSVEQIKQAMANLSDGYRVVFSLYLLEGYDHKEIASILKISEATSKSQFSRAKAKMRMLLEKQDVV
ncbi:MAG: RNA polymerase sigma factor [Saprospiraceae bacterium]|nr:RNA polymerase sigma factor [Saprospiraceae bacterium]